MTRGPIDFLIVGFDNTNFDGSILKALEDASDKGIISVLALSVVAKDSEGVVTNMDYLNMGDEAIVSFSEKYVKNTADIDAEDVDEVSDLMENNTAAGILVVEHLWAIPLKEALAQRGAFLIADGRIHPEAAAELE